MNEYWVYILRCKDGSYYTGITNSLDMRISQHQEGNDPTCYTFMRRPVELVYSHSFREVQDAIKSEKQIQGWSRRKKEALIKGDIPKLQKLSMSSHKRKKIAQRSASSPLAPTRAS